MFQPSTCLAFFSFLSFDNYLHFHRIIKQNHQAQSPKLALTALVLSRCYFIVPGVIFVLDKVVTLRTRYIALDILETELLPSDVLKVKFYRPPNMKVLSGRVAIGDFACGLRIIQLKASFFTIFPWWVS